MIGAISKTMLLLLAATSAVAQVPAALDTPALKLSYGGAVRAAITTPDGAIIIGGEFAAVNDIPRANIARIAPDGTVDPNWNPGADRGVYAFAIDNAGALIVGGEFQTMGGLARSHLAKFQPGGEGTVDPSWNPYVDSTGVFALTTDSGGSVYVGGLFGYVGGYFRNGLAKISTTSGATDPDWNPAGADAVNILALKADNQGSIFAGGYFSTLGGQTRHNIAKLSAGGTGTSVQLWNPSVDSSVNALVLDGAGHIYVGGDFSQAGGLYRAGLAKIAVGGSGVVDATWNPPGFGASFINAMSLDGHGGLYVGGDLHSTNFGHTHLVKLSTSGSGSVITAWTADADDMVYALTVGPTGNVYIGGIFSLLGGQSRVGFGTVDKTAAVLPAFNVGNGVSGRVTALARQPDGGLVIGGSFAIADGVARDNLVRIKADGALDMQWDPGRGSVWDNIPEVEALAANNNGDIFVSGGFTQLGGQTRTHLAKLQGTGSGNAFSTWDAGTNYQSAILSIVPTDSGSVFIAGGLNWVQGQPWPNIAKLSDSSGQLDTSWNPAPDDGVNALVLNGTDLYAGGAFNSIGGQTHHRMAKLSTGGTGAADASWTPDVDEPVYSLALEQSGALYIGGDFSTVDGQAREHIARLAPDGSVDMDWSSAVSYVSCLAVGLDDYLYMGGVFNAIDGQPRTAVARLARASGALDTAWNPVLGVDSYGGPDVKALMVQPDDSLIIGGGFDTVGGQTRTGFARLEPDDVFHDGFEQTGVPVGGRVSTASSNACSYVH